MTTAFTTLAQITSDALGPIVPWLVGFSAVLFLLNQGLTFWKTHMREQPTPADTYATKRELNETHGRISRERKELDATLLLLREEDRALRSRLDGEIKELRQSMDDIPERTIDMLRKTKDLL